MCAGVWEISWDCASFWVLTVEGSGYFVRYCGVLMECREKGSKFVVSEIFFFWEVNCGTFLDVVTLSL